MEVAGLLARRLEVQRDVGPRETPFLVCFSLLEALVCRRECAHESINLGLAAELALGALVAQPVA